MIDINLNKRYDTADATFEILIMLAVAFILGYLLCYIINKAKKINANNDATKKELRLIKQSLEKCIDEKTEIKKAVTLEYIEMIEEYKSKLNQARKDLEQCLISKAEQKK